MPSSLLALLDDIATVLDDVAALTKVATKKTAGVLGDDLALNAQQVAGVDTNRELPVVWAVAKGSLLNKAILVPVAIAISALAHWLITPLLMLGGAFLCFEGFEKVAHKLLHDEEARSLRHEELIQALSDPSVNLVAIEKRKIQGAIRTDFILSAEIVAITLGAVEASPLGTQVAVLVAISIVMTVGVYGLVAGIVKIDDLGAHLVSTSVGPGMRRALGGVLLRAAPKLMKLLTVAGTIAMFLVGGGIIVHGIPPVHHAIEGAEKAASAVAGAGPVLGWLASPVLSGLVGVVVGGAVVGLLWGVKKARGK